VCSQCPLSTDECINVDWFTHKIYQKTDAFIQSSICYHVCQSMRDIVCEESTLFHVQNAHVVAIVVGIANI